MKLNLKKAIPILTSALLVGSSFAAAAISSVDQWKSFGTDTAIIIGANAASEDTIASNDFTAALQAALSGAATTPVTGEAHLIKAPGNELNYGESFADVDEVLDKTDLPILLADGKYNDQKVTVNTVTYTQKLEFVDNTNTFDLLRERESPRKATNYLFIDDNYNLPAYNYSLKFDTAVRYDPAQTLKDFRLTKLNMLGRDYTIVDVETDSSGDLTGLTLMGGALEADQVEYTTQTYQFMGKTYTVEVVGVYDNEQPVSVLLKVNGEVTDKLAEGEIYTLSDGTTIGIKATLANEGSEGPVPGAPGNDRVQFWLGAEKIELTSGEAVRVNDKEIDGSEALLDVDTTNHKLKAIYIWASPEDEVYLDKGESWTDPVLGRFKYTFQGIKKNTETITFEGGSDDGSITLKNVKEDKLVIPLINDDSGQVSFGDMLAATEMTTIPGSSVTTTTDGQPSIGNLLIGDGGVGVDQFDADTDLDNVNGMKFLAVSDGCEARIIEIARIREGTHEIKFKGVEETFTYTPEDDTEFDLGFTKVTLNISETNDVVAAVDTMKCPTYDFRTSLLGYVDLENLGASGVKFKLYNSESTPVAQVGFTVDESSDQDIEFASPEDITSPLKEEENSDWQVARDNAGWGTFVRYDGKEKQDLTIEYPEDKVVANVYVSEELATIPELVAGASGAPVSLGNPVVLDTELTSEVKAKNLIIVGGSAINRAAAEALDLPYPTYGSSNAWQTATGVTGEGQAILKLLDNPYTAGKQALLVAGWSGSDTRKAAKALVEGIPGIAGKASVRLDTSAATAVIAE
ncbi:MAG: S-layer protein [Candidatus Pacearchaeota archaeon]